MEFFLLFCFSFWHIPKKSFVAIVTSRRRWTHSSQISNVLFFRVTKLKKGFFLIPTNFGKNKLSRTRLAANAENYPRERTGANFQKLWPGFFTECELRLVCLTMGGFSSKSRNSMHIEKVTSNILFVLDILCTKDVAFATNLEWIWKAISHPCFFADFFVIVELVLF